MRRTRGFAAILCAAAVMTGCASTPEQAIVREKSGQSADSYKEAGTEEPVTIAPSEVKPDGAEADTGQESASVGLEKSGASNALAARLQAPEKYEAQVQSEDGAFTLDCSARVDVPAVDKISIYKVGQMDFSQEWIDKVTEAFFGDAPVYNGYTYNEMTKDEVLERLNQLKAWQAEGNTDPYGYIAVARESGIENPEEFYDIQQDIDVWEQTYAEAPETTERTAVKPGLDGGFEVSEDGSDSSVNNFIGMVEMDGQNYRYQLKRYTSMPMIIDITNYGNDKARFPSRTWYAVDFAGGQETAALTGKPASWEELGMTEEKAEETAGITPEEAQKIADGYMEKLGLSGDFSAKNVMLSLCTEMDENIAGQSRYIDAGYQVDYTRDIDGFPVTDEMQMGGGLESMESTLETWSYEKIQFTVNKDGIQHVEINNLYEIGEQQVANVELMTFPEIAKIFESMLQIQNSDMTYSKGKAFDIDHVTLGYMRVYDPGADNVSGLLVPVWDFFGKMVDYAVYEDQEYTNVSAEPTFSRLTVNAADGTVINRELGY